MVTSYKNGETGKKEVLWSIFFPTTKIFSFIYCMRYFVWGVVTHTLRIGEAGWKSLSHSHFVVTHYILQFMTRVPQSSWAKQIEQIIHSTLLWYEFNGPFFPTYNYDLYNTSTDTNVFWCSMQIVKLFKVIAL